MHVIPGELRKAPYVKTGMGQDGQTTMFIIELSEMIKDRKTGEKLYTNYSAAIFAKSPAQIDYYHTSLVQGNYVVVNCEKLKVKVSDCKQYIKLEMDNARLEDAKYIEPKQDGFKQAPAQQQGGFAPQQQAPQQRPMDQAMAQRQQQQSQGGFAPQQQAPQQRPGQYQQSTQIDYDDDIPF